MIWLTYHTPQQLARSQMDRDEKIENLIKTMNEAYFFADDISRLEEMTTSQHLALDALVKQTTQCGYFIKSYLEKRSSRTISLRLSMLSFLTSYQQLRLSATSSRMLTV
jgi:hypothetical protein